MEEGSKCSKCGKAIPAGEGHCPWCEDRSGSPLPRRETVVTLSLVGLGILFVATGFTVRFYHAMERSLAVDWYRTGESSLRQGAPARAVDDLRNALFYSRDNSLYRLRLSQALIAARRPEEAEAHLLNLWERQPGDGTVNLELARLAAGSNDISKAARFYHNAIYGVWPEQPEAHRRQVRFEYCELLLAHQRNAEAQAAILELATQLPRDPVLISRVGTLFLRAEDYSRAFSQFQQALRIDSRIEEALQGAGLAAFQLGNYRDARRYLERAVKVKPDDTPSAELLEMTQMILSIDPIESALPAAERARRVVRAFEQARKRLELCAQQRGETLEAPNPETELQDVSARLAKVRPKVRERYLERNPDLVNDVTQLVFLTENVATRQCGPAKGLDQAILLVARKYAGGEQ